MDPTPDSKYEDILYEVDPGSSAAVITINRPHRYNAFRGQTVEELPASAKGKACSTR